MTTHLEEVVNTVIQGDCLEVMKDIPDKCIDMVLTSPPYDNLRTYNGSLEWGEHIWKPVIQELFRVVRDGGVVVWVVGDATIKGSETGTSFKQALYFKEVGFNLHDTMIYEKSFYAPKTHRRYEQVFEYMFVLSKNTPKTFNGILKQNVMKVSNSAGHHTQPNGYKKPMSAKRKTHSLIGNIVKYNPETKSSHTAPFPEKLAHDHIISWSNEGDTILDPFAGSGTVGKIAKQLNRGYILIEKEPEYVEIIKNRLEFEPNKQQELLQAKEMIK
jgi:DNA modification methylase